MPRALLLTLLLALPARGAFPPPPDVGIPVERRRVMVVSVDGLRPDVALRADMPTLRDLMARGTFTLWAHTVPAAKTLPSHTSMLTGVPVETHGIDYNDDRGIDNPAIGPRVPTFLDLARAAGLRAAMAAGKEKFWIYAQGDHALDDVYAPRPAGPPYDDTVTPVDHAVRMIRGGTDAPHALFVHVGGVDAAGHAHGWGTDEQLAAAADVDRQLGRLVEAHRAAGTLDETLILLSADHGGTGANHGADNDPSRFIPWVAAGPGVRANYDLTRAGQWADGKATVFEVKTEDTFATACWFLGLTPRQPVTGRPVEVAFPKAELMD